MINVKELPDGKLEIEWDQNDPIESILNDWTEKDFQDFFAYCLSQDSGKLKEKFGETSNVYEATKEDWEDFWEGDIEEDDITEEN